MNMCPKVTREGRFLCISLYNNREISFEKIPYELSQLQVSVIARDNVTVLIKGIYMSDKHVEIVCDDSDDANEVCFAINKILENHYEERKNTDVD